MVPTYALHRDPEFWPDPETFNPDRFTQENKESIDQYAYMPFGLGPRNCIGMRFALVAMKLAVVEVLQRFDISLSEETKVPLELDNSGLLAPKNPIKLKFTPRKMTNSCNNNNINS
ncbi:cytochrome P450 3A30-like [Clarias magur]|uniref:Cytochrome P450 3A30-like n=1 Tax=Clarias magur TaxID=1594786 RepID=A0A8J4WT28_CLAMG|nr:cytochrome P450 3A30-like [Clarias magur]